MRRLARLLLAARVGIACSATEPDGACDAAPPTEVLPTGWYEVAIRVSIDGHDRLFFAREDTISAAAAGFCDAHAAASGDCPSVLAARAAAVLQRCPVLVMLSDDDHSLACRWVRAPQPPARPAPAGDGSLAAWFNAYGAAAAGPLVVKYRHYFDVYERHLSRFRGRRFKLLEVGIAYGGSVRMWRAWLGEAFEHHCLDVDPATVARVERDGPPGTRAHLGNQSDAALLARLVAETGGFDVVLDDGSHVVGDQRATFDALWPSLRPGGAYVVEDTHTSLWPAFGGGGGGGGFIDFAAGLARDMHAWHAPGDPGEEAWRVARSVRGVSTYESVVVVEKHTRVPISPADLAPAARGGDAADYPQISPAGDWVSWPAPQPT